MYGKLFGVFHPRESVQRRLVLLLAAHIVLRTARASANFSLTPDLSSETRSSSEYTASLPSESTTKLANYDTNVTTVFSDKMTKVFPSKQGFSLTHSLSMEDLKTEEQSNTIRLSPVTAETTITPDIVNAENKQSSIQSKPNSLPLVSTDAKKKTSSTPGVNAKTLTEELISGNDGYSTFVDSLRTEQTTITPDLINSNKGQPISKQTTPIKHKQNSYAGSSVANFKASSTVTSTMIFSGTVSYKNMPDKFSDSTITEAQVSSGRPENMVLSSTTSSPVPESTPEPPDRSTTITAEPPQTESIKGESLISAIATTSSLQHKNSEGTSSYQRSATNEANGSSSTDTTTPQNGITVSYPSSQTTVTTEPSLLHSVSTDETISSATNATSTSALNAITTTTDARTERPMMITTTDAIKEISTEESSHFTEAAVTNTLSATDTIAQLTPEAIPTTIFEGAKTTSDSFRGTRANSQTDMTLFLTDEASKEISTEIITTEEAITENKQTPSVEATTVTPSESIISTEPQINETHTMSLNNSSITDSSSNHVTTKYITKNTELAHTADVDSATTLANAFNETTNIQLQSSTVTTDAPKTPYLSFKAQTGLFSSAIDKSQSTDLSVVSTGTEYSSTHEYEFPSPKGTTGSNLFNTESKASSIPSSPNQSTIYISNTQSGETTPEMLKSTEPTTVKADLSHETTGVSTDVSPVSASSSHTSLMENKLTPENTIPSVISYTVSTLPKISLSTNIEGNSAGLLSTVASSTADILTKESSSGEKITSSARSISSSPVSSSTVTTVNAYTTVKTSSTDTPINSYPASAIPVSNATTETTTEAIVSTEELTESASTNTVDNFESSLSFKNTETTTTTDTLHFTSEFMTSSMNPSSNASKLNHETLITESLTTTGASIAEHKTAEKTDSLPTTITVTSDKVSSITDVLSSESHFPDSNTTIPTESTTITEPPAPSNFEITTKTLHPNSPTLTSSSFSGNSLPTFSFPKTSGLSMISEPLSSKGQKTTKEMSQRLTTVTDNMLLSKETETTNSVTSTMDIAKMPQSTSSVDPSSLTTIDTPDSYTSAISSTIIDTQLSETSKNFASPTSEQATISQSTKETASLKPINTNPPTTVTEISESPTSVSKQTDVKYPTDATTVTNILPVEIVSKKLASSTTLISLSTSTKSDTSPGSTARTGSTFVSSNNAENILTTEYYTVTEVPLSVITTPPTSSREASIVTSKYDSSIFTLPYWVSSSSPRLPTTITEIPTGNEVNASTENRFTSTPTEIAKSEPTTTSASQTTITLDFSTSTKSDTSSASTARTGSLFVSSNNAENVLTKESYTVTEVPSSLTTTPPTTSREASTVTSKHDSSIFTSPYWFSSTSPRLPTTITEIPTGNEVNASLGNMLVSTSAQIGKSESTKTSASQTTVSPYFESSTNIVKSSSTISTISSHANPPSSGSNTYESTTHSPTTGTQVVANDNVTSTTEMPIGSATSQQVATRYIFSSRATVPPTSLTASTPTTVSAHSTPSETSLSSSIHLSVTTTPSPGSSLHSLPSTSVEIRPTNTLSSSVISNPTKSSGSTEAPTKSSNSTLITTPTAAKNVTIITDTTQIAVINTSNGIPSSKENNIKHTTVQESTSIKTTEALTHSSSTTATETVTLTTGTSQTETETKSPSFPASASAYMSISHVASISPLMSSTSSSPSANSTAVTTSTNSSTQKKTVSSSSVSTTTAASLSTPGAVLATEFPVVSPNLGTAVYAFQLTMTIQGQFNESMNTNDSFKDTVKTMLLQYVFEDMSGLTVDLSFRNGSVICEITMEVSVVEAQRRHLTASAYLKRAANNTASNKGNLITPAGPVDVDDFQENIQGEAEAFACSKVAKACDDAHSYSCQGAGWADGTCVHKCDVHARRCGDHGECFYDWHSQDTACRCVQTSYTVYHGHRCEQSTKTMTFYLAMSLGIGGVVVLILVTCIICICFRARRFDKTRAHSIYDGSDWEVPTNDVTLKDLSFRGSTRAEPFSGSYYRAQAYNNEAYQPVFGAGERRMFFPDSERGSTNTAKFEVIDDSTVPSYSAIDVNFDTIPVPPEMSRSRRSNRSNKQNGASLDTELLGFSSVVLTVCKVLNKTAQNHSKAKRGLR